MDNRGSFSGDNQFINELKNKRSYISISLHACNTRKGTTYRLQPLSIVKIMPSK